MTEIRWEDPPPPRGTPKGAWVSRLEPLIDHPKRWARINDTASEHAARQFGSSLRTGKKQKPPGRWEFAVRGMSVYARYLGPDEDAS